MLEVYELTFCKESLCLTVAIWYQHLDCPSL